MSYSVQILSQFMHKPRKSHLDIAFRVIWYLKSNPGKGISITKSSNFSLVGYVDANRAKCLVSRRSVIGYFVSLAICLVSWKSKKQSTMSQSSIESEYCALVSITCEIMSILKILFD